VRVVSIRTICGRSSLNLRVAMDFFVPCNFVVHMKIQVVYKLGCSLVGFGCQCVVNEVYELNCR